MHNNSIILSPTFKIAFLFLAFRIVYVYMHSIIVYCYHIRKFRDSSCRSIEHD